MNTSYTECSESAFLVIAKSTEEKNTAHFLAFTNDEGEAIRMARENIWPGSTTGVGMMVAGGDGRRFDQFTVKRVWCCYPLPDKKMFVL